MPISRSAADTQASPTVLYGMREASTGGYVGLLSRAPMMSCAFGAVDAASPRNVFIKMFAGVAPQSA